MRPRWAPGRASYGREGRGYDPTGDASYRQYGGHGRDESRPYGPSGQGGPSEYWGGHEERYRQGQSAQVGRGVYEDERWRPQSPGYGERGAYREGGYGGPGGLQHYGQGPGGHRPRRMGRGPKGYKRSDERIREDLCDRLSMPGDLDASDVEVSVTGGEVTLAGTVPDRATKHEIELLADSVSGVTEVHNQLRVKRLDELGRGTESASTPGAESAPSSVGTGPVRGRA